MNIYTIKWLYNDSTEKIEGETLREAFEKAGYIDFYLLGGQIIKGYQIFKSGIRLLRVDPDPARWVVTK